jgi:hypothetical protein
MPVTKAFTALAALLLANRIRSRAGNSRDGSVAAATVLLLLCSGLIGTAPSAFAQSTVAAQDATNPGATMWVTTTQRIKSKVYENARLSQHPILVIVVHGDSPDGPPTYQYRFAEKAAAAISDAVVAAVLRPGYSDGEDSSDGMRGFTTATTTRLKWSMRWLPCSLN